MLIFLFKIDERIKEEFSMLCKMESSVLHLPCFVNPIDF